MAVCCLPFFKVYKRGVASAAMQYDTFYDPQMVEVARMLPQN